MSKNRQENQTNNRPEFNKKEFENNKNNVSSASERILYLNRMRKWERLWACLLLISLGALLFYQGSLYLAQRRLLPWPDWYISGASWYGADYDEIMPEVRPAVQQADGLWGSVTIELQNFSELHRAAALINGVEAGSFSGDTLTLRVFDDDLLEIDCTAYAQPATFRLIKSSVGINRAALQTELTLCGERGRIGRIKFK